MIAGPNGSGKTTLTDQLRRDGVDFGHYINADDIAATLTGPYVERVRQAQDIAARQREACIAAGSNFSFETVMSHPSKIELLSRAKAAGFTTGLFFVATESVDLNVARVEQRVALGGHSVPEKKIRERYARTLSLLPQAMSVADLVVLYDNSWSLRPFFRQLNLRRHVSPPVPVWAIPALIDTAIS